MIPTAFDYVRPKNLNDALKALGKNVKVIAGGHSLLPLMRFRLAQPDVVIDIARLPQLKGIKRAGGGLRIGATTTYRELLESKELRALFPLIAEVTEHIGDLQVRNVGTIGGGLAHADPAADMPPVMLVLDATFVLQSKAGKRSVAARKFFKGPFEETLPNYVLPDHEMLVINIDCDLYLSASFVLKSLAKYVCRGTYIYFDEFCDRSNELRAFNDFVASTGKRFRPVGASRTYCHVVFECLG